VKGLGVSIAEQDVIHDFVHQVYRRTEDAAADAVAGDQAQPLKEPGGCEFAEPRRIQAARL
jgi:hypothetical protein